MPIMAAHERNDARGAARLLARIALECISDPAVAADEKIALRNAYRLLESYRSNAYFGLEPQVRPQSEATGSAISLAPTAQRHVKDVKTAMDRALTAAFTDQARDQAIEAVLALLKKLVKPNEMPGPAEHKEAVERFFGEMLHLLDPA